MGLGLLWDMALWKFGFVVRQQTLNIKKNKCYVYVLNLKTIKNRKNLMDSTDATNKNKIYIQPLEM